MSEEIKPVTVSGTLKAFRQLIEHGPAPSSFAAPDGYAADGRCAECGCRPPGHIITCKTGNEVARKSQAVFAARYRDARRKGKRYNDKLSDGSGQ